MNIVAKHRWTVFMGALTIMLANIAARAGDGWPLRNGDFCLDQFQTAQAAGERPDWQFNRYPDVTIRREDTQASGFLDVWGDDAGVRRPGTVILQAEQPVRAAVWQDVWLLPGDYTFRVDGRVAEGSAILLNAAGIEAEYSGADWSQKSVDFPVKEGGMVRVQIALCRPGEGRIRNARIDARRVIAAPAALEDGRRLGAIVLSETPTEAERYAAWELQKYIFQMTGKTPGVEGRDQTDEGTRLVIGRAAGAQAFALLAGRPPDSYLMAARGVDLLLVGNNDRGTLYAAYTFLKLQGCGWFMPGPLGEVVPRRAVLRVVGGERIESPDWNLRSIQRAVANFDPDDTWFNVNRDEYADWCVRNRLNAYLGSETTTMDFGAWRGGSHLLWTGHTWNQFWMPDGKPIKPEWAPLVAGRRKPLHDSGRPNMPCTSNQELRDRTVEKVLDFFRANPDAIFYGVSADDEPNDWCECPNCRAQDPDKGAGAWQLNARGMPAISMTDRSLNYVNEVADRVAKVFPGKRIEWYAYASTKEAPVRERVHPNVLVTYVYGADGPLSLPTRDCSMPVIAKLSRRLDAWKAAGAQAPCLYDYGNYAYRDTPQLWFRFIADYFLVFHETWGFRSYLKENNSTFPPSHMAYNLRARLMWDRTTDYRAVIREVCDGFYGPAAQAMYDYYMYMDEVYVEFGRRHAEAYRREYTALPEYSWLELGEFSHADMAKGKELLDRAWEAAGADEMLRARLALVRFGHALMTYTIAASANETKRPLTRTSFEAARSAWELARALRRECRMMVYSRTTGFLKTFGLEPPADSMIFDLPIQWKFRKDPADQGLAENWFQAPVDASWTDIRTDAAWTDQGHDYQGVAWYAVEFTLSDAARAAVDKEARVSPALGHEKLVPAFFFRAVDGYADIFLDGVKIGEQKLPPQLMWNQGFSIALPKDFAPDKPHRLAVRVDKDSAAAGIWKPVSIMFMESLVAM